MPNDDNNYLEQAAEYWRAARPLDSGRLIFQHLPAKIRPKWATRILELVVDETRVQSTPIERIRQIGEHETEWVDARQAFSAARRSTLALERLHHRSNEQELLLRIYYLAENVAKVIYNATDPIDEFDEDSGWWIASCLNDCVVWLNHAEFSKKAWLALCDDYQPPHSP